MDGFGFGELEEMDEKYFFMWVEEIFNYDLLYWVFDGVSWDICYIQQNMKCILDLIDYYEKIVVVFNKVDNIELDEEDDVDNDGGWNCEYNYFIEVLERLI